MSDSLPRVNLPELSVSNRQRAVAVDAKALLSFGLRVLPECAAESGDGLFALRSLGEVTVTVVSDRRIAQIHRDFMDIPGPTDVITFQHGDIVMSADTALSGAAEHGHSLHEELGLYLVHGLLHLNGFVDGSEAERRRMHAVQNRIWRAHLGV